MKSLRIANEAVEVANQVELDHGVKLGPLTGRALLWLDSLKSVDAWTLVLSGERLSPGTGKHMAEAMIEAIRERYGIEQ